MFVTQREFKKLSDRVEWMKSFVPVPEERLHTLKAELALKNDIAEMKERLACQQEIIDLLLDNLKLYVNDVTAHKELRQKDGPELSEK